MRSDVSGYDRRGRERGRDPLPFSSALPSLRWIEEVFRACAFGLSRGFRDRYIRWRQGRRDADDAQRQTSNLLQSKAFQAQNVTLGGVCGSWYGDGQEDS